MECQHLHDRRSQPLRLAPAAVAAEPRGAQHHQPDQPQRATDLQLSQQLAGGGPRRVGGVQPHEEPATVGAEPQHLALRLWRIHQPHGALGHERLHGPPHEQPPRLQRRLAQQQRTALERPGGAELPAWQAAHDLAPALRHPPPAEQPLARGQRHGPHGHGV